VAELAGIGLHKDRKLDGTSLKDVLLGQGTLSNRHLFLGYVERSTAVREKNWKFIKSKREQELYDLNTDPGEQRELGRKTSKTCGSRE